MRFKALDTNPPPSGTECLFTDGSNVFLGTWCRETEEFCIRFCKDSDTALKFDSVSHYITVNEILKLARR